MQAAISSKPGSFRVKTLFAAVSAALLTSTGGGTAIAQQDSPEMEEVIVTGSLIRRSEGFTAASPMTTMTNEDMLAEGTVNPGEIAANMTFNQGSATTGTIQGTSSITTSFNLRGLGSSATLQLLDGKRTPTDNVNVLFPSIAVQRMEIVTDGAAALYGTDAVAGVVNMVPYTAFDGFRAEVYHETDDSRGNFEENHIALLGGTTIANEIDVVGAASFRKMGRLRWRERPDLMAAGLTSSATSNPGNFLVPHRDENGLLTGEVSDQPDPACGERSDHPATPGANPNGFMAFGNCWMEFGDTRNYREATQFANYYTNAEWDASPDLTLAGQFMYARRNVPDMTHSSSNPGGRTDELPTIRGELPGNPFRAVSADGRELYAQPRMDGGEVMTDAHGRPLPQRGADGQVMLADDPFDPNAGVPFYEDVEFDAWRPIGRADTLPVQNEPVTGARVSNLDNRYWRFAFTADFTVPYVTGWDGSAFYTQSGTMSRSQSSQDFSMGAMAQGLNCDVVNDADACFNPFGVTDDRFATSQAVMDQVGVEPRGRSESTLETFDLVFNGEVPLGDFELPGGPVGAAVGYQRRWDSFKDIPNYLEQSDDIFIGSQEFPTSRSRHVDAVVGEMALPVLPNFELNLSARNESYSDGPEDTIGKIGAVYEPTPWLGLRATYGQAFIAPTMGQLSSPRSCGLTNVDDPFSTFSGFVASCSEGNPDLVSETSDSMTLGVDVAPIDGLDISLTWSETDFTDRIVSTTTQDIMRSDFFEFQQATGFTPTDDQPHPTQEQLRSWLDNPASDDRVRRNPDNLRQVLEVTQSDSNASEMLVRAWDLDVDFSRPFRDWGTFRTRVQATYMDTYEFQLAADRPQMQAVGNQNNDFGAVPPIPEIQANWRFGWSRDNHNASATVRYTDAVTFDASDFSFQAAFPHSNYRSVDEVRAWTQVDAFYQYRDFGVLDGNASLTFGVRNLFDRQAQKVGMTSGIVGQMQNPLGRVYYSRLSYDF